jgi:hypothetical protein
LSKCTFPQVYDEEKSINSDDGAEIYKGSRAAAPYLCGSRMPTSPGGIQDGGEEILSDSPPGETNDEGGSSLFVMENNPYLSN